RRQNTDVLGAALLRGDNESLLKLLLGSPDPAIDDPQTLRARKAFDERDNDLAMRIYPRSHGMERRILSRLMNSHRPSAAVHLIDQKLRRLWISALQSRLFNQTLAKRIESNTMDRLLDGHLAMKHENGAGASRSRERGGGRRGGFRRRRAGRDRRIVRHFTTPSPGASHAARGAFGGGGCSS